MHLRGIAVRRGPSEVQSRDFPAKHRMRSLMTRACDPGGLCRTALQTPPVPLSSPPTADGSNRRRNGFGDEEIREFKTWKVGKYQSYFGIHGR